MKLQQTTSQTVGPFLHIGLSWLNTANIAPAEMKGERVTIEGRVLDGAGSPVTDALLEVWQANPHGKYAHPEDTQDKPLAAGFKGFGRIPTDGNGKFAFETVKPGRVPGPEGRLQAPHLVITLFMRGLLKHLTTRIYFPEEPANQEDAVLALVPPERRSTLIAAGMPGRPEAFEWNVILQGNGETVFFDFEG
jgi:protocatechuate 3,4-dioxygenase alpha subunit